MSLRSEGVRPAPQDLSALMDGELESSAVADACRFWRDDPQARSEWHAYHLIGDVMRSEDLAVAGERDAAFLMALRARLSAEPVVLAPSSNSPAPGIVPVRARRSWATSAAVAAGFAVVAGTLVVTQMAGGLSMRSADGDETLARAPAGIQPVALADAAASGVAEPPVVVLDGQLVRNARLDEYLAAHKRFGGSSLPGGPSGFLRNAAAEATPR